VDENNEYQRLLRVLRVERVNLITRRNVVDEIPSEVIEEMYWRGDAMIVSDKSGSWLVAIEKAGA
jgi:hypothetical protein